MIVLRFDELELFNNNRMDLQITGLASESA